VWLDQVFAVSLPIKTPADLRCWCQMQLEGLEQLADAYPVGFCWAGRWLFDWDLLQEAGRLLPDPDAGTSTCPAEFYGRLKEVSCTPPPPADDDSGWLSEYLDCRKWIWEEEGFRPPEWPSAEDFQMLVQRAWGYIRRIARKAGSNPPEEPEPVSDEQACRSALHEVVAWCLDMENPPPEGGHSQEHSSGEEEGLRVRAEDGPALSQTQFKILEAMFQLKAFDSRSLRSTEEIAKRVAPGSNPESFKKPIADLKNRGFVKSKKGAGGGCWLTQKGKELAGQDK
jgi:hypothetical protein